MTHYRSHIGWSLTAFLINYSDNGITTDLKKRPKWSILPCKHIQYIENLDALTLQKRSARRIQTGTGLLETRRRGSPPSFISILVPSRVIKWRFTCAVTRWGRRGFPFLTSKLIPLFTHTAIMKAEWTKFYLVSLSNHIIGRSHSLLKHIFVRVQYICRMLQSLRPKKHSWLQLLHFNRSFKTAIFFLYASLSLFQVLP